MNVRHWASSAGGGSASGLVLHPSPSARSTRTLTRGDWMQAALRRLDGDTEQLQERALADLVTTDNPGAVPPTFSAELIGVIDLERPFLASGQRLRTPESGMNLIVPAIAVRPTVGNQDEEKYELTSTGVMIEPFEVEGVTVAGAGDLSIQILKRSTPSFLNMYLNLLAEAYAHEADAIAVAALLAGPPIDGGTLNPANFLPGAAWELAAHGTGGEVRLWLSMAGVEAFVNAKEAGTNVPIYPRGLNGSIGGMTPIHVPALDGTGVDAVIGPTDGIFWAEATYTLQADVPSKAGRDVALVGILWVNAGAGSSTTYAL